MSTLYHLYGLAVRSDFELPEVSTITPAERDRRGLNEVEIISDPVPRDLPDGRRFSSWMQVSGRTCLYHYDGIAKFLIEDGERIVVDLPIGASEVEMRTFLLGSAVGTLVHMRKLIPLHISAVVTENGLWAFSGPSGAGKSTTVAQLHYGKGYKIFCDDVAVLDPKNIDPILHSGVNRLRLWGDVIERLEIDISDAETLLTSHPKMQISNASIFDSKPARLDTLSFISGTPKTDRRKVSVAVRKFERLMNSIYRPYLTPLFNDHSSLIKTLSALSLKINTPP